MLDPTTSCTLHAAAGRCASAHCCAHVCEFKQLRTHFFSPRSYWEVCEDLLQPAELAWLRSCDNPPVKVMAIMSGLVKR